MPSPENPPRLLAIQVDAGKVQMREANPESGSRWRDDKVATIVSYLPGEGAQRKPEPLVTTHVGTMDKTEPFGRLVRVEAQRRGYRYAAEVIALADCGNWIDPLLEREFPGIVRIADWAHAEEHLHDCGRAVAGPDGVRAKAFSEPLVRRLWEGGVKGVVGALREAAAAGAEDLIQAFQRVTCRGCTPKRDAICCTVACILSASRATFALNAAPCRLRLAAIPAPLSGPGFNLNHLSNFLGPPQGSTPA